jgi:hypothetical protein
VVTGGEYKACVAVSDVETGDGASASADAMLADLKTKTVAKLLKAVGVIKHMMSKIYLVFVLGEMIGETVVTAFAEPIPVFEIVAYGRPEISKTLGLHFEGESLSACALNAKRPVKPVFSRIPELVFKDHGVICDFLYKDVSAGKFIVDLYHDNFLAHLVRVI